MRLPNGYGTVYKLSGNRRKPWIVRKTVGWSEDNRQVYDVIGYYEKREDALKALADYNSSPYDLNTSQITFSEVYDKWSGKRFAELVGTNGYKAAYKICEPLHKMRFTDIKADHMQGIIDKSGKGYATRKNIKILFGQLFKYSMERDIVTKDYSKFVSAGKSEKSSKRKPFTHKEIDKLWARVDKIPNVDLVLISIYSGWRPGELVLLETKDIDLPNRTMFGGIKTDAGKERIVPINKKILPLIEKRFNPNSKRLITDDKGKGISYVRYYDWFMALMETLNMAHTPHDTRHTLTSLLSNAEANKVSMKRILGHSTPDVTDGYTHKDIEELTKAIDLI